MPVLKVMKKLKTKSSRCLLYNIYIYTCIVLLTTGESIRSGHSGHVAATVAATYFLHSGRSGRIQNKGFLILKQSATTATTQIIGGHYTGRYVINVATTGVGTANLPCTNTLSTHNHGQYLTSDGSMPSPLPPRKHTLNPQPWSILNFRRLHAVPPPRSHAMLFQPVSSSAQTHRTRTSSQTQH